MPVGDACTGSVIDGKGSHGPNGVGARCARFPVLLCELLLGRPPGLLTDPPTPVPMWNRYQGRAPVPKAAGARSGMTLCENTSSAVLLRLNGPVGPAAVACVITLVFSQLARPPPLVNSDTNRCHIPSSSSITFPPQDEMLGDCESPPYAAAGCVRSVGSKASRSHVEPSQPGLQRHPSGVHSPFSEKFNQDEMHFPAGALPGLDRIYSICSIHTTSDASAPVIPVTVSPLSISAAPATAAVPLSSSLRSWWVSL